MAVNKYIGARYIPLIDGEWSNAKTYEPLIVVTHLGNSYTSKTFVPLGIDISNDTYWCLSANYNVQVEQYRQEVTGLSATVTETNTLIDGINTNYEQYQNNLDGLTQDIANTNVILTQDIANTNVIVSNITKDVNFVKDQNVNVLSFGAKGDGVTDDYNAFLSAYNYVKHGGTITVPNGTYLLSSNPDNDSKAVNWKFDNGTKFVGNGVGSPDLGSGEFASPKSSNPWLIVSGNKKRSYLGNVVSPRGGGVMADSYELKPDSLTGFPKTITGTITNGSAVMTNVSDVTGIEKGYAILAVTNISGWESGSTKLNAMRVVSVDKVNKTITFGLDDGQGAGVAEPTPWNGETTTSAVFQIRKRHWQVLRYEGANTGDVDNVDVHYHICNPVMNITGTNGAIYEFDMNLFAETTDFSRALFVTGIGDVQSPCAALDIQRGGQAVWSFGVSVRNSEMGLFLNANQPITIDSEYHNNATGTDTTIVQGIMFSNMTDSTHKYRALLSGQQLVNGSCGIAIKRKVDSGYTGRFLTCLSADELTELFMVDIDGAVKTPKLTLGQIAVAQSDTPSTHYLPIYDGGGTMYKLLLAQ